MLKQILFASSLSVASMVMMGCVPEMAPFDPRTLQQSERKEAKGVARQAMQPLPTTLESPFLPTLEGGTMTTKPATVMPTTGPSLGVEPVIRLPLQEVIQRAVANSLGVRVAGYDPAVNENRVIEAEARFDPTFFTNTQYERRDRVTGGSANFTDIFGAPITDQKASIYSLQSGVRQNLAEGGQAELRYETTRNDFTPPQTITNPYYENQLVMELTQPLLRNFGGEVNRANITIARYNQRISLLDFRKTMEDTAANIEKTYWQLVLAMQDVRIQERLLQRTEETAELLAKRGAQDVTRVQTSQANAAVQTRRANLIRAKSLVRDLSDKLKQLMNDPDLAVSSNTLILPASEPVEDPIHFNLDELINAGMENRLELAQQQLRIESASLVTRVAKNNLLPQLNLKGSVGAQGLGKNYGVASDSQDDFNHWNYTIGLQFEVPIGNRQARAIYQRSLLQRQQAIVQYQNLISQVSLDVKTAFRSVQTNWDEMVSTRQARFATADSLQAIVLREQNNEPLTPTFVQLKLDTQERLANAEREEIMAVTNYNTAISQLEQAKGTLLKYDNVLLEEERTPLGTSEWKMSKK